MYCEFRYLMWWRRHFLKCESKAHRAKITGVYPQTFFLVTKLVKALEDNVVLDLYWKGSPPCCFK